MIYKITKDSYEFIINTDFITFAHFIKNESALIYVMGKDSPIVLFESEYREIEKELIKQNHKFLYERG